MTQKRFWQDPYQTSLETQIRDVIGSQIWLEETIFFAFSGGQESDSGTIGAYPVLKAEKRGTDIAYTLPEGHRLSQGEWVRVEIDWERRYRLMRLHFAAEIILELVYRRLTGIEKIGAHIAQDKARIDFVWQSNIKEIFPQLLHDAAAIIQADSPIISDFSDPVQERRFWHIEGFAQVACGGTHLKRTGEVGAISLNRKNIGGGKERIEIFVGK